MIEFCSACGHRIYPAGNVWRHLRTQRFVCEGGSTSASPNPDHEAGSLRFDLLICEEIGVDMAIAATANAAKSNLRREND